MPGRRVTLGYALSSEEHRPNELVADAWRAEEAGFRFAIISDCYHPWTDGEGQSPFVWSVLGGIAQVTEELQIGTGVTCPIMRIHPAIIAQAAASVATMLRGRFFLGVGTGEYLDERITGQAWPTIDIRLEMLEEAIAVIRALWTGEQVNFRGVHYCVEDARVYTLPEKPPPIMIAAGGEQAALLAGRCGDGLIGTPPEAAVVQTFQQSGGEQRPRFAQVTVCWGEDEEEALKTARELLPATAPRGRLHQEPALPAHFEESAQMVRAEDIAKSIVCGPDAERYIEKIDEFASAGYDHVYLHQVGPDQEGFFRFCEQEILPYYGRQMVAALSGGQSRVDGEWRDTPNG